MIPFSYVFNNFMILGFLQWCFSFTYRRVDNFILQSAEKNGVDEILSLQNVIIPKVKIKQTLYLHRLPFVEKIWTN